MSNSRKVTKDNEAESGDKYEILRSKTQMKEGESFQTNLGNTKKSSQLNHHAHLESHMLSNQTSVVQF